MRLRKQKTKLQQTRRQRIGREHTTLPKTAFSYHNARSEEVINTGRQPNRDITRSELRMPDKLWHQRLRSFIVLLIIGLVAFDILNLSTNPKVIILSIPGNSALLSSAVINHYQISAKKLLAGSILNRNKITIDTGMLSSQLKNMFPDVASVSISLPLASHQPIIYIQPSSPSILLKTTNESYIVNTQGNILSYTTSNNMQKFRIPTLLDPISSQLKINQQVLTTGEIVFIETVVKNLAIHQLSVKVFTLLSGGTELDAQINNQPYFVKFNLENSNSRQQVGTFLATLATLRSQNITPTQYIDVRVDGRAYYK